MKRRDLIRYIEGHGCVFVREGSNHTLYKNPANSAFSSVPRHREVKENLARKICDDLGVPRP
jgi:mRNA interferase HicA